MENITVQSRITPELKEKAEDILNAMGLKTSEAIRLFLQQVVNSEGLPFRPSIKVPNKETYDAIRELESGGGKKFKNSDELFKDLEI